MPHLKGAKEARGDGFLGRMVGADNAKALRGFVASLKRMQNTPYNEAERRFVRHARYRGFLLMSSVGFMVYTHPEAQKHWLEVAVMYENWKTGAPIDGVVVDEKAVEERANRFKWIWGERSV